jgi:antitoxin HigA-1
MMHTQSHPGRLIAADIEALGFSVSEAAKAFGITRQQLHKIIAGKSAISTEMALRLELGIGGSAQSWLKMQAAYDEALIRNRPTPIKVTRLVAKAA